MWNDKPARPEYPSEPDPETAHPPAGYAPAGAAEYEDPSADFEAPHWSPEQLTRLEGEWRKLQRAFAYHPHVTVQPLKGDPPGEYQLDFRLTTLVIDDAGQLQYAPGASVHVWLPPEFPNHPPLVRPLTGLFHPNVSWEGFHLESAWGPTDTLVSLVRRLGDLLTYRTYDPDMVVNGAAMDWLSANAQSLPVDARANFAPTAGGEPLGKIIRFGEQTIEGVRQSLQSMQRQLLGRVAPDPAAVRDYSLRTRLALDLFLDGDVPDNLRSAASALHECARELPQTTPTYDYLRTRRAALESLRAGIRSALDAQKSLAAETAKLSGLVAVPDGLDPEAVHDPQLIEDPSQGLRLLPEPAALQPFQLRLPKLVGDTDRRAGAVRSASEAAGRQTPPQTLPSDTMLGQRLEQELAATEADTRKALAEAADALAVVDPVLQRGREDAAALEQVARYREYVDLLARGRQLERRLAEWGGEGVQAFFIQSGQDRFGPFQFEQPVDLGGTSLVVRNPGRGAIEVYDASDEKLLGQSSESKVTVEIGGGEKNEGAAPSQVAGWGGEEAAEEKPQSYPMEFQLTDRCDDLLVQLDFLRRQTQDNVEKIDPAANGSASWAGVLSRQLSHAPARSKLKKELAKISQRWRYTMLDLAALGPLKARLSTYHLLARGHERIPVLVRTIKDCRRAMKESEKRLAEIVRRCSRDVETDRLIVPPKYDQPYQAERKLREETSRLEAKSATLLKTLVLRLTKRLKTPKLLGRAGAPSLRVMQPLPAEFESLPLLDADLGESIDELEQLLHTSLGGPRRLAPPQGVEPEDGYAAEGAEASEDAAPQEGLVEGFQAAPDGGLEAAAGGESAGVRHPHDGMDGGSATDPGEGPAGEVPAGAGEATPPAGQEEYFGGHAADGYVEDAGGGEGDFVVFDEPEAGHETHG